MGKLRKREKKVLQRLAKSKMHRRTRTTRRSACIGLIGDSLL